MKSVVKKILLLIPVLAIGNFLFAQSGNFISMKQKTEILENKKKLSTEIDLFLDNNKKIITKYYHSSPDFIMVVNSLGEIKTYYPEKNEVDFKQVSELSSKRNLIYYFVKSYFYPYKLYIGMRCS